MENENVNILKLFSNFYLYKKGVLLIFILILLFTTIYIKTETPIYSSNILIRIESDDASNMNMLFPNTVTKTVDMESKLDYEKTLLKSYRIIFEILDEVDFFQKISLKGVWRDEEIYIEELPFNLNWKTKFRDNEKFKFEFEALNSNSFYIYFKGKKKLYSYGDTIDIENYKLKIDKRSIVNKNNHYIIKIDTNRAKIIQNIIGNISISKDANQLLNIKYEDTVAPRIKIFLNKLILSYKRNILEKRQERDSKNILFYNKTIKELEEVLFTLGNKLKNYKSNHSELSMIGLEDKLFVNAMEKKNRLSRLLLQLNDLKTTKRRINNGIYSTVLLENSELRTEALNQLLTKFIKKKTILERLNRQKDNMELLVIDNLEYIQYLNELKESKNLLRKLRADYTDNYSAVQELKEKIIEQNNALENYLLNKINLYTNEINSIKKEIIRVINDLIKSIEAKYSSISKLLSSNKNLIDNLPNSSLELNRLKREFKLNEENYKTLLRKRSEAMISKASNIVSIDIIDMPTIPQNPIKPKKNFLYFSGLIVALLLSILYISIRRYLNKTIQRASDFILNNYELIVYEKNNFQKNLWKVISIFEKSAISSKVIALTSNEYVESKKDILIELAITLASINKKVLIVDFDIYYAIFSNLLSSNKKGLSNILTSKHDCSEIDIEHYIVHEGGGYTNIDFLFSGPILPNGSKLLFNEKVDTLIYFLRDRYDYILIDFAPIGIYPVMNTLLKYCDSLLIVAEKDKTDKSFPSKLNNMELNIEEKIVLFKE